MNKLNPGSVTSYDLRPGNEVDYSGRKERDGQKEENSQSHWEKGKVKKEQKTTKRMDKGEKGVPIQVRAPVYGHKPFLAL